MHESSMLRMSEFINTYLNPEKKLTVLDVGSWCKNDSDTYKNLMNSNWEYTGLDITKGKNVDIVVSDPYNWKLNKTYDVVISGQCMEHVQDIYQWIREVSKAMKPKGFVCLIVPWNWREHKYPYDCWRILPDGMSFLLTEIGKLKIIKTYKQENDCIGIATK